jgi:hypothetical protein
MATPLIQADAPATFGEVEEALKSIRRNEPNKLFLRIAEQEKSIGINAAIIQLIAAWANLSSSHELICDRLPRGKLTNGAQNNLAILPLAATCLAREIKIESNSDPVRSQFYSLAAATLDTLNAQLSVSKPLSRLFFMCADGTSRAYSDFFYSAPDELRPLRQFRLQVNKAIHQLSFSENYLHSAIAPSSTNAVSDIIYELFKNTHQWARTDIKGTRLRQSLRGLLLNLVDAKSAANICKESDALSDYLRRNVSQCSHFFEVSIFDSGPGFAQRFRNKPISEIGDLDAESSAIHGCLKLHSSSAEEAHRGVGLHYVLCRLDEFRAFLKLRTGRLCLSRSFDQDRYIEREASV